MTLPQPYALLAAIVCGALVTFSLAPYDNWPTSIASLAGFIALLSTPSPKQAFWRGWAYGLGLFGFGVSWVYISIHVHGNAPVPLAILLTATFCAGLAFLPALQAYLWTRFIRGNWAGIVFGFPALWVLFEWLRSWLFTGFPWLYLGYAHLDTPLSGWAPIGGVFSISFLVALSASLIYIAASLRKAPRILNSAVALLIIWTASTALTTIEFTHPKTNNAISVALIQPNIPLEKKWDRAFFPTIVADFRKQTLTEIGADIILWPESAIPAFYQRLGSVVDPLAEAAQLDHTSLLFGIPYQGEHDNYYNSIVARGNGSGDYLKQRLVPFGEYVPLENWLRGLIAFFDLPMSHFSIGPTNQAMLSAGNHKVGAYICYEVVYPDLVAKTAHQADLLVTISNDSWFGRSIGPLQHLQMAQMRALENGRYMLRGTNNGVTAVINHRGQITARLPQFEQGVLRTEALAYAGNTPFARLGSLPVILLCIALLLMTAFYRPKHNY